LRERKDGRGRGFKWVSALAASICVAGLLEGGSPAYGRPQSESDDSMRSELSRLLPAAAADFALTPYRTGRADEKGGAFGPRVGALQEQPFVEKPVRLRVDDPEFSRRSPLLVVTLRVFSQNLLTWAVDRFVFNYPFSHIGSKTWNHNLQTGWEWDTDRLGMNFFFHPYTGGGYFMAARANGYGFLGSLPFSFFGSLMWEYFGERSLPSYNDIINTTLSGAFFGEILYRLSSNLLDDRTTGAERVFRELGAALISPGRAISRLLQGKSWRTTSKEVYQKEPLNASVYSGLHWINKGARFGTGSASALLNLQLDYGDPFEIRPRKPFDFFKVRIDLNYGKNVGGNYLDNVVGYGLLLGNTIHSGDLDLLFGAFQHFNFWDSKIFELGAVGIGGGLIARWKLSGNSNFRAVFHLGVVPLGASNSPRIDIVEEGVHLRNYDYSGGADAKFESTLNLGNRGQLTAIYYFYRLYTYVGPAGFKNVQIFRPRVALRILGNLSLGFEYAWYHKASHFRDFPDVHVTNGEQKLYMMLYF
jgi:hypothetical protein